MDKTEEIRQMDMDKAEEIRQLDMDKTEEIRQLDMDRAEEIRQLENQIWIMRISRVNAEARLKTKESFIQVMNIYYSCCTVLLSIGLLMKQSFLLSLLSVIMASILTISLFYLKCLRHAQQALAYRKNYAELRRLELRLDHLTELADAPDIEKVYSEMMGQGKSHIPFDYYTTIANSSGKYREENWKGSVKVKYYWGKVWRFAAKLFFVLLPVLLAAAFAAVYWYGEYGGWKI